MITVEIWSDFVCPYCFVGKKRFDQALALLTSSERDQIQVAYKAFRLDPHRDNYDGQGLLASFIAGGLPSEKAERALVKVAALGADAGLIFDLENTKPTNTTDAHRLLKFAASSNPATESALMNALFEAYFLHGRVISDRPTLIELAKSVGLDPEAAAAILADPMQFKSDVEADEQEAYDVYFEVVPHFYINRKYEISAVHPVEIYLNALKRALLEG